MNEEQKQLKMPFDKGFIRIFEFKRIIRKGYKNGSYLLFFVL